MHHTVGTQVQKINQSQFVLDENNEKLIYKVTNTSYQTTRYFHIKDFTYEVDDESKTKTVDGYSNSIVLVQSTNYQMVSTPTELANIKSGFAYKLANDIDMTGVTWVPKDVSYIMFDGNGYSINNLRNVQTYVDTNVYYGLFRIVNESTITNLNMNNTLFMITLNNSTTSTSYYTNVGSLAGQMNNVKIQNITLNGEISVNNQTGSQSNVGGMSGTLNGKN